ncbi:hypothetical protein FIBSPDRAFT_877681 [Athelia psychrophila]|uniref:Uncharacterized protein n=1 Tax=Athelia psychrophila TaxID=1759441 RepID=A0A167VSE1_9AGAM|nr:hypothetical protein FIBSPDRAFT_877681 [Fibularhizoctonia sp. CBS 109695]
MTAVPTPSSELLSYWAPYAISNSDKGLSRNYIHRVHCSHTAKTPCARFTRYSECRW